MASVIDTYIRHAYFTIAVCVMGACNMKRTWQGFWAFSDCQVVRICYSTDRQHERE